MLCIGTGVDWVLEVVCSQYLLHFPVDVPLETREEMYAGHWD